MGDLTNLDVPGDLGAVGRAEAVGDHAVGGVALRGGVRVLVHGAGDLIGPVGAVGLVVAEEGLVADDDLETFREQI